MIAVVAAHVVAGDRSIDRDRRIQQTLARDSVFAIAFVCFSRINIIMTMLNYIVLLHKPLALSVELCHLNHSYFVMNKI